MWSSIIIIIIGSSKFAAIMFAEPSATLRVRAWTAFVWNAPYFSACTSGNCEFDIQKTSRTIWTIWWPLAISTEQSSAQEQSQTSASVASPRNTYRCRRSTASRPLPSKRSERSAPRHRASSASSDSESLAVTGEPRSFQFLMQQLSVTVQLGNAACILGTVPDSQGLDDIYYLWLVLFLFTDFAFNSFCCAGNLYNFLPQYMVKCFDLNNYLHVLRSMHAVIEQSVFSIRPMA